MEPRVLGDELVAVGRRVRLLKRKFEFGGSVFEKDVVAFGEAVVAVPVLDGGRVVMVRQWRPAVKAWVLEVPAGRVEPGEGPEQAARRELEEEVGYAAGELVKLATAYATPGYSDEVMHFFAALKLEKRGARPEAGEVLEVVEVDPDAYLAMAGREVLDLKTVAALALCRARGLLR